MHSSPDALSLASIILPTYNWSAVLPFSIASALDQSFGDFELIVVGDGCTDDTEAVVRSFADARIRFVNLERNSGAQSAPNNAGVELARGRWIFFLNHDDHVVILRNLALTQGHGRSRNHRDAGKMNAQVYHVLY